MTCEEVRELLPAYVDGDLHLAGEIESHLASCVACTTELGAYRELVAGLEGLRDGGEEPAPELLHRALALVPSPSILNKVVGSFQARPLAYGLASMGGAAIGAAAVALVWWRLRRSAAVEAG